MGKNINKIDMVADKKWAEEHMGRKKWKDFFDLSEDERRKLNGWLCGKKVEPLIPYNKAEGEEVIQGPSNSRIVFGRDRTSSKASGYGGKAGSHCAMIDLVAGTHGNEGKETDEQGLPIMADPAFKNDAARIYITQKADIDDYFGIRNGEAGRPKNKSAVAIKADNIRIIAREGIKLVTGTDDANSQGGYVNEKAGIDLIAGNDDSDMQPLVKGEELVIYLENIVQSVQELSGIVNHFWTLFLRFETVIAAHQHPTAGVSPSGPTTGMALPSPQVVAVVTQNVCEEMTIQMPGQIVNKVNSAMQELDGLMKPLTSGKTFSLNPFASLRGRLLSKNNYTN